MSTTTPLVQPPSVEPETVHVALRFYAYFLKLGATGFGGPIALAGFMQRGLVERLRCVGDLGGVCQVRRPALDGGRVPRSS